VTEHKFSKTYRIANKPKAFKQESKGVVTHTVSGNGGGSSLETNGVGGTNGQLQNKKKAKSTKETPAATSHITFGRHGVRFIPRQVFAMPQKPTKAIMSSAANNQEMTDLSGLQEALPQPSASALPLINGLSRTEESNSNKESVNGMES
jgi:hypothetical protein